VAGRQIREIAGAWKGWTSFRQVDCDLRVAGGGDVCAWETELRQFRANGSCLCCIAVLIYFVNASLARVHLKQFREKRVPFFYVWSATAGLY